MKAHSRLTNAPLDHILKALLPLSLFRLFRGLFGIHIGTAVMSGSKLPHLIRESIHGTLFLASLLISSLPALVHASPSVAFGHRNPVYIDVRSEFNSSVICPDGRYYRTEFGTYINCENFNIWHEGLDNGLRLIDLEMKFPL